VTGDIDAMWLRDSSAQLWPHLRLAREDETLRELVEGRSAVSADDSAGPLCECICPQRERPAVELGCE